MTSSPPNTDVRNGNFICGVVEGRKRISLDLYRSRGSLMAFRLFRILRSSVDNRAAQGLVQEVSVWSGQHCSEPAN